MPAAEFHAFLASEGGLDVAPAFCNVFRLEAEGAAGRGRGNHVVRVVQAAKRDLDMRVLDVGREALKAVELDVGCGDARLRPGEVVVWTFVHAVVTDVDRVEMQTRPAFRTGACVGSWPRPTRTILS